MNTMIKKLVVFSMLAFCSINLMAQSLEITGNMKNVPDQTVVTLLDGMANKEVATATAVGGKFELKTTLSNTGVYVVSFKGTKTQIPLFVGNDKLSMEGDVNAPKEIVYQGSPSQDIYQSYMKKLDPLMSAYFGSLGAVQAEKNATKKDSINKQSELQSKAIIDEYVNLSKLNNQSPVSTFFLFQMANIFPTVKETLIEYYDALEGDAKKGTFADVIEKTLQTSGVGKMGSVLPEFTQNDVNGKPIKLSSLRGKYVLVDFWASWCGPCRAENPNVVKTYNAFKNKNFTVLGVSLDQDKARWLEAIKKDGLSWSHVSDLKYWNNEVAVQFGIQSIPASFLIDPNGVIIGKDLRGDDLVKALKAVIK
jgi:peroxiredoxin